MPKKKVENFKVDDWLEEISSGLEFRRKYGLEDHWADLEALFYNVHVSSQDGPNLIVSIGDSLLSSLCVPKPYISVKPRRNLGVTASRVLEGLDNDLLADTGLNEAVEDAVLHSYLWGVGILKIGYDSEWGWNPEFDLDPNDGLGLSLTSFSMKGQRIEYDSDIRPGMPWVRAVLPHDIIVPWGVRDLTETPWIAHRIVRHIDDIKSDVKYSNKRDLRPVMSMDDFVQSYLSVVQPYRMGEEMSSLTGRKEGHGKNEYCELFEIHDKRTGRVKVISTGNKGFLRDDVDMLNLKNGLPFVGMSLVPKPKLLGNSRCVLLEAFTSGAFRYCDSGVEASKNVSLEVSAS